MTTLPGSDEPALPAPDGSGLSGLLLEAGRAFLDRKEWARARDAAHQLLGFRLSDGEREQAFALLARSLDALGEPGPAEDAWSEARALCERAGDAMGMARVWREIGLLRKRADRLSDARDAFSESLRCSASTVPGQERARGLEELGVVERLLGESTESLRHLEEALRIWEALASPRDVIRALEKLANVKQRLGRLGEAEADYLRAIDILTEHQDPGRLAIVHNNLGGIRHSAGDHEGAIEHFETAHELFRSLDEKLQVAVTLSNLGLLHSLRGENARARTHLEEGLAILESLGEWRRRASVLNNLSLVAYTSGRYEEALRWANTSLDAWDESETQEGLAKPLINQTRALLSLSRLEEAERAARRASGVAEKSGSTEDIAETALALSALALARNDLDAALTKATDAAKLAGEALPRQRAEALRLEARVRSRRDEEELARDRLLESESLFSRLADPFHRALCGADLGRVFLGARGFEAAATRLRTATGIFAKLGNEPKQFETLLVLAEAEHALDAAEAEARLGEASELARHADRRDWSTEVERTRERLARDKVTTGPPDLQWVRLLGMLSGWAKERVSSPNGPATPNEREIPDLLVRELGLVWTAFSAPADTESALVDLHAGDPNWASAWSRRTKREPSEVAPTPSRAPVRIAEVDGRCFAVVEMPSPFSGVLWIAGGSGVRAWNTEPALSAVRAVSESIALCFCAAELHRNVTFAVPGEENEFEGLIYASSGMARIASVIEQVADSDAGVLIRGESGTGKELIARALHARSGRAGRFIAINCPSVPRELIESELFGSEKGAFTGADRTRVGQIELADQGTLFLDEVGDMEMPVQTKLLRFLEERELMRVGGRDPISVDVRLVAATSRDLDAMVEDGTFRADLLHRIMVVPIVVPPLRERSEDVSCLVRRFAKERSLREGRDRTFAPEAVATLSAQPWKGNVRELRNVVHRIFALSNDDVLTTRSIPEEYRRAPIGRSRGDSTPPTHGPLDHTRPSSGAAGGLEIGPLRPGETLTARLMEIEGTLLRRVLEEEGWNQSQAARRLGIKESTLRDKNRKFGIKRPNRGRNR
ncbi:MAG: sigma 54-interacting transcriptional regulator [Candidatus Eisenbacteria bacterium]